MADRTVVFYISGHGFGHASRSIEVINALIDRRPRLRVIIRSSVAPWLVTRTARPGVELNSTEVDTGVVQLDSLHLDAEATIERAKAFMSTFSDRVANEEAFLHDVRADLTVSDLPPLGIAAARAADIPGIALGNFTWDWIYQHYATGADLAGQIGDIYAHTTVALRLPMWGGFATMPSIADVPLVARQSHREKTDVRRALGLPLDRRIVLTSFGGYGLDALNADALARVDGYHVLLPGMLDEQAMYDGGYRYEDLVKAVDVVVTKPGYGIISECAANDTALLYTSRGDFREYQVLVEAMPQLVRCEFIGHDDLFAGRWRMHLDSLLAQARPPRPDTSGAAIAAMMLLERL